jgi:hypothetical protein
MKMVWVMESWLRRQRDGVFRLAPENQADSFVCDPKTKPTPRG